MPYTNINTHFYLGNIYERQKDCKRSIQLFKQCLNLDKTNFGATIHLATLLANCGETTKASKYFEHALKLDPESPAAHFSLGKILHSSPDSLEEAADHYLKVLEKEPHHYKALCQLGIYYMEKSELEKAAEYLKDSIKINSKYLLHL